MQRKLFNILNSLWGESLAIALTILLYPFKFTKLDKVRPGADILLIHGYLHNDSAWRWFRKKLQNGGAGPVNTVCYPSLKKGIPECSFYLKEKIEEIRKHTGREPLVLIGHSEGGLVALEYALMHAPKDQKTFVITLGTPLQGLNPFKGGIGPAPKQMMRGSSFLKSLKERLEEAHHLEILAIGSGADLIINPPSAAFLPDLPTATNIGLANLGLMQLIYSKRVTQAILAFLEEHKLLHSVNCL